MGFADAVVPLTASPEQRVEVILAWMKHGPTRWTTWGAASLNLRDPRDTLNYRQLLRVCGTATNAFVNLAARSGLRARRLLLLRPNCQSSHVVAEVWLNGRWVVVDPAYRTVFRDAQGRPLTVNELRDLRMFQEATQKIPGYPASATLERTAHVRLAKIPIVGAPLQVLLERTFPAWDDAAGWTPVLERESLPFSILAALLIGLSLMGRFLLGRYGERRLGFTSLRLRQQFLRAGVALFTHSAIK